MANLAARLSALLGKTSVVDNEEALDLACKALKASKGNNDALHTQIVALIKLDRFEDALQALNDGGQKTLTLCILERAYALYKLGKLTEAELLLNGANKRGLKHLAAQVAYRAEKFTAAMNYYKDLRSKKSLIEGEEVDLMVNISATDAQLEWQANGYRINQENDLTSSNDINIFEISYNFACKLMARKDFTTAYEYLRRARELCDALDEMDEEEKKLEILPIMLQQAYVLTKLGKQNEAENLHKLVNIDKLEPSSRVIAHNNCLASSKTKNPFMAQRILSLIPKLSDFDQLFWYQANILQRNKIIIDIEAQKYLGVARSTSKLIVKYMPTVSSHYNHLSVINAAAHARNKAGKPGLKAIIPLLEKRPSDVGLILLVVQLCVLTKNLGQAIFRLEKFLNFLEKSSTPEDQDVRFAPGLIGLLVSLYRLAGRKKPIRSILLRAASYWIERDNSVTSILYAACLSLLESQVPEDLTSANELLKSIRYKNPNDQIALAGYIASCDSNSIEILSADIDRLTPVSHLISGIDIDALENNGVPSFHIPSTQSIKKRNKDVENLPAKRRKLSKKRMPKNYEESKKLDPERWLAKRDRSDFRPSTKKGKKRMLESTQGGFHNTNTRNKGRS